MGLDGTAPGYVIVGYGPAGLSAAETILAREPDACVTVISEEADHFYSRPALLNSSPIRFPKAFFLGGQNHTWRRWAFIS